MEDECLWSCTTSMTPEGPRLVAKPVPFKTCARASLGESIPRTPAVSTPLTASVETTTKTPDCDEYAASADLRSPPGMLNSSPLAEALIAVAQRAPLRKILEYLTCVIVPPLMYCEARR